MTETTDTEIRELLSSLYSADQYLPDYPEWWLDPMDRLDFENVSEADKKEMWLEFDAMDRIRDGDLIPFAKYLWHSRTLNMPRNLRETLLGMLFGDSGYRHRLQVAKHPELKRRPKSVAEVSERRKIEVLIIRSFIEGGGLDHFESGVNHALANHPTGRKVGWSTVASVMTSRRMKAARAARDKGETFSEQVVSAFIQEANKDELWSWQKFAESVLRQLEPDDDTDTPF
jgi:hypothetical protein